MLLTTHAMSAPKLPLLPHLGAFSPAGKSPVGSAHAAPSTSSVRARSRRTRFARPAHSLTAQEAAQIRRETAEANTPLWALIVAQLDPMAFEYRMCDLEGLLSPLKAEQIRRYARKEFPGYFKENGQYCLDFNQAVVVIYRACSDAYVLPNKVALRRTLIASGQIPESFPYAHPAVESALQAIQAHRKQKAGQRQTH